MRDSKTLGEMEEHWKEFLSRLERVWNKAANHFGKSPKWNGWQGSFLKLRKTDPLLAYLINARGADEHTISDITKNEPGFIGMNPGPSGVLHIKSIQTINGVTHIDADSDAVIHVHQPHIKLLPILNRGVSYEVPVKHLDQPIDPNNLIDIAEKAIAFYDSFLSAAENFFVRPAGSSPAA